MNSNNPIPRLLVVDDEKDIGEFISFVATNAGYAVTCIDDSHDFIDEYSDDLCVIVMDLSMPGIDGVELIRHLASVDSKAGIILMSGFDSGVLHSAKELADSRGLNILGTLEKPISINSLELILKRQDDVDEPYFKSKSISHSVTVDELAQAIKKSELVNYYQPKVDMASHFMVSMESLVRWNHPEKGLIMPDDFIALAEDNGLINDLTYLVLDQALTDCSELKSKGIVVQVAVNISAKTLTDLDFPDQLQDKLMMHKLDPSQLIIEVTESAISEDFSHALEKQGLQGYNPFPDSQYLIPLLFSYQQN